MWLRAALLALAAPSSLLGLALLLAAVPRAGSGRLLTQPRPRQVWALLCDVPRPRAKVALPVALPSRTTVCPRAAVCVPAGCVTGECPSR